ncbi:hypothetical protein ASE71_19790 [Ensifer sp. Root954]|nr:hypothetical protein ASE71_19790 [Ensifer sp. Root954]
MHGWRVSRSGRHGAEPLPALFVQILARGDCACLRASELLTRPEIGRGQFDSFPALVRRQPIPGLACFRLAVVEIGRPRREPPLEATLDRLSAFNLLVIARALSLTSFSRRR